ncbi:putative valyl-tRNA synthetase [Emiliania huxleyi CCMP1516]|uniref:valine--tRNA ligase n=2 Tax=Emiliania huxleyi TaxID=2903 RepID=A0A0D3I3D2_EMIH1|nr:putative valyl-tRNA synthetase [Emiliania huxleyi CCMP1516]EOD05767.1 putative valyl-tRNA synthetase [Emiliania huxleyi CCMP1516]|eukprot:XP_005758196.1 putative valyl-tRNA synthetase [Emiliania huxleyi CCMP1516]
MEQPAPTDADAKKADKAAKKAAKEAKFAAKKAAQEAQQQKQAADGAAKPAAPKEAPPVEDPAALATAYVNPTPAGELKAMSGPMAQKYLPHEVEASWNAWWEASGYYRGNSDPADTRPKFSICLPPPNVTGSLHLGHALTVAVQDLLARWKRMSGYNVLWIPGTDHAGIATQVVVEKKLKKERGLTRHDLGREEFLKTVFEWKEAYGQRITMQLRRLGCSLDWSREVFTMDEQRAASVKAAFLRFHKEGLIYRDVRLTNWCCILRSGISDIEVEYEDLEAPKRLSVPGHPKDRTYVFGRIWSFAYKVDGSDEEIVVATTRPETMLGDVAVAVHPDDPRYKQLHGKQLVHPFVARKIKLILDPVLVDMSFGTGAVKVTPAHDPNDFACGRRHGLDEITVFTEEGKMADNCGMFAGMMRFDARVELLAELKRRGLHRGEADNKMRLGVCQRTGDIIEPMLKPQWWVDCSGMARRAVEAVRQGELKIIPAEHERTWYAWLENIRDWCVSRQLWWGHRIPAYFPTVKGEKVEVVVAGSMEEAREAAAARRGGAREAVVEREGCAAEDAPDYAAWHPTSLLETGQDILFFWVARMVMLPFSEVYLHAMVRDKRGRKMSKSLGNELAAAKKMNEEEFPLGIPERDVNLDIARVAWILSRLAHAVKTLDAQLTAYDMAAAVTTVYEFWYKELCDVYLEAVKPVMKQEDAAAKHATQTAADEPRSRRDERRLARRHRAGAPRLPAARRGAVLHACLHHGLRLLHPFMPYVTEELYQRLALLAGEPRASIMVAPFPQPAAVAAWASEEAERDMELLASLAASARARGVHRLPRARGGGGGGVQLETLAALAKSSRSPPPTLHLVAEGEAPPAGCATDVIDASLEVHVLLKGLIDLSREVARLQKEAAAVEGRLAKLQAKMAMPEYATKCKPQQQQEDAAKAQGCEGELAAIGRAIAQFEAAA